MKQELKSWCCPEHGIIPTGTVNPPDGNGHYHCPECGRRTKWKTYMTINWGGIRRIFREWMRKWSRCR